MTVQADPLLKAQALAKHFPVRGERIFGPPPVVRAVDGISFAIAPGETVMGFPARPRAEFLRAAAGQRRIPDLMRRVRAIEKRVGGGA